MQNQSMEVCKTENFPLVTVLMLSYKKFEYIYEAFDSVLGQDYPNYELIIADDGSENFPEKEITEYIDKNAGDNLRRVLIYSNDVNLGTVKNCNIAIKKSRGEYIMGISPDDEYADYNVISSVINEFQNSNALVITCKRKIITEDGIITDKIKPDEHDQDKIRSMRPEELYKELLYSNFICGASTYYDRRCFEQYNLFDERFFLIEDWPAYLVLLKNNIKIHFFDRITLRYRLGGVSTCGSPPQAYVEDIHKVYEYFTYPYIKKCIRSTFDLNKKQVIYGTGNESDRLLKILHIGEMEPLCYVVSDGFSTENVKNDFPVYQISDVPFKQDELHVLISKMQTDAGIIIDNLKSKAFFVSVIDVDDPFMGVSNMWYNM